MPRQPGVAAPADPYPGLELRAIGDELLSVGHDEWARLLRMPDRRARQGKRGLALLHLLGSAGLRRAEAASLLVSDVDERRRASDPRLRQAIARSTSWWVTVRYGKRGHSRAIPLEADALAAINRVGQGASYAGELAVVAQVRGSASRATRSARRSRRSGRGCGPPPQSTARPTRYPSRSPMAVPKQKQSHSRTAKRRATHKIAAPTYNACPQCHSPRLPHRVCPVCGTYAGREVLHPHDHDHDHDH